MNLIAQRQRRRPSSTWTLIVVIGCLWPEVAQAQPNTGTVWETFGPSRSSGVFTEITGVHNGDIAAYAVAADRGHRIVTVNQWKDAQFDLDLDCAVTRHFPDARTLDM